jgi:hypothetical protein
MASSRRPHALKVPSLAPSPLSGKRGRFQSGEYLMTDHVRAVAAEPEDTTRNIFDSELPTRMMLELERQAPISGSNEASPTSTREMDGGDFERDSKMPSCLVELEMRGMPIRQEAWPKSAPSPYFGNTEERSVARAIPPPPPSSALRRPTTIALAVAPGSAFRATDTKAVIAAFAGFGAPPTSIWQTPSYALHVFRRRGELARDLAYARRGRSPDVALFEAAMDAYHAPAATTGRAIIGALAFALVALSVAALVLM